MSERVSLIDIYVSLRENNIPNPVAAAIATATYRALDDAKPASADTFADVWRRNARFVCVTMGITAVAVAVALWLTAR